ncbi:fungal-specific transcription factor domain-domain-containing protein [Absidia repens]|uniref:Fungal-specific transcription factor domain-domain-containing protein n=1 Tax=Absidia repens TaxID=90262 RepID=A0A1X2J256_9FUNG|nr:fungal-specific transcription factor domain-domain-containing protein [Absidia repens]
MAEEIQKKRQRVSRACEQCRRKKVKCLGSPPTCNNCLTLGLRCQYLESTKKRGPPKGYIEAIEGRLQRLEALLGTITQEDDPRSQAILAELNAPLETAYGELVRPRPIYHTSLQGLDNVPTSMMHMKNEGITHDENRPAQDGDDYKETLSNYGSSESFKDLKHRNSNDNHLHEHQQQQHQQEQQQQQQQQQQLDNLSIDDSGQLRYYGKSSGFDMLRNFKTAKNESVHFNFNDIKAKRKLQLGSAGTNSTVDPFERPPDDLSQHLLDLYFNTFYPWLPIIHKDSFMERISSKDNPPPALLLNAIYAVASRVSSDIRVRSVADQPDTAGDIFFERARLLMDFEWDDFKVYTVQSLLLMSSHQNGALKTVRGWLYSGMAFRMAQNLGLHRNCESWALTDVEKEERKRCFYCCLIVDRITSTMHGRSPVLDERDYDALYPTYEDKDKNGQSLHIMEGFHHLIKLCELLGDVLRELYMVRGRKQLSMMACPDATLSNLDRGLNKWMAKLPASMQYRPPNTRLAERSKAPALQLCQLHMLFYTTLILLHRPFIPGPSTTAAPSVFPSASICTFAANKILDISESLLADGLLIKVNNYALYFMFTAGIIFIHNAQSSDSMFAFEAKISINKIMRAMDEVEKTWSTSARHCNILGALAGLRDIDLRNVDESYSRQKPGNESLPPLSIAVPNSPEPMDNQEQQQHLENSIQSPASHSSSTATERSPLSSSLHTFSTKTPSTSTTLDESYTKYYTDNNFTSHHCSLPLPVSSSSVESTHPASTPVPVPAPDPMPMVMDTSLHHQNNTSSESTSLSYFPLPTTSKPSTHAITSQQQHNQHQQQPFDPNATAFWGIPSSFDIQEWNSYLSDQAHRINPMMMPPVIEQDQIGTTPNILSQELAPTKQEPS